MRLSDLGRSKMITDNINWNRDAMDKLQEEASSGKRILNVADNPGQYASMLRYNDAASLTSGYITNIQRSRNDLNTYESMVTQVETVVREAKTLTIQASNVVGYSDNYGQMASRANQMLETMATLANNASKGEYMFSGSKTLTQPFVFTRDSTGNISSATYQGDNMPKVINPDTSQRVTIDLSGDEIFSGPAGMGQDLFQELISLRDDMQSDMLHNKEAHLTNLDAILNRVINKSGEIGSVTQHLDRMEDFMKSYNLDVTKKSSEIEYVDMAETISALLNQETSFQGALEVAARLYRLTLIDYMR